MFDRLVISCVLTLMISLCRGEMMEISLKETATCATPVQSSLTIDDPAQNICLPMKISVNGELQDYVGFELKNINTNGKNVSVCYNITGDDSSFVLGESCYDSDSAVILTNSTLFDALVNGELIVKIGAEIFTVRYFSQGFHLLRGNTFNISEIDGMPLLRIVFAPLRPKSGLSICQKNIIDGNIEYFDAREIFSLSPLITPPCTTPTEVNGGQNEFYALERNENLNLSDLDPIYELVISTVMNCSLLHDSGTMEQFTSEVITITVSNPSTDPTAESPTTSPPTDDGDGGSNLNVETIVGVVVGLVVLVAMVSGIAAVIFLRWRKQHRNIKKGVEDGGHHIELEDRRSTEPEPSETQRLVQVADLHSQPPAPDKKDKTVMVWDLVHVNSDNSELVGVLASNEDAKGKPFPDPQNNGMSLENQVYSTLRKAHCVRLYIIYEDSLEQLNNGNRKAWEVVRSLQSRPLPTEQLSKVVLVRVHGDSPDKVTDTVEGPVLTVNLHRNCLQENVKTSANLICSRARINQKQTTINDSIDGSMRSVQNSQEASPTPTSPHPTASLPSYSSTAPSNQNVPNPVQSVPGEMLVALMLKDLNKNVEKLSKINQCIADNTGRAADNTEGMGEKIDEFASGQIQLEEIAQNNHLLPEAEEDT